MAALNNTPLVEESAPQAQVQTSAIPLGALAPALKQQVPSLTYGAHNYSSDPAKRAVVLNGREWREGNEIAPVSSWQPSPRTTSSCRSAASMPASRRCKTGAADLPASGGPGGSPILRGPRAPLFNQ
jgi:hypothetical protein